MWLTSNQILTNLDFIYFDDSHRYTESAVKCGSPSNQILTDFLHFFASNLKSLLKYSRRDFWVGPKSSERHDLSSGALTVEPRNGESGGFSHIEEKVQLSPGEHKHIPDLQNLSEELVGCVHKPHQQLSFNDERNLGGSWMDVRRNQPSSGEVSASYGHSLRVESRQVFGAGERDVEAEGVGARIPRHAQSRCLEVGRRHRGWIQAGEAVEEKLRVRVRNAEILQRIRICAFHLRNCKRKE